MKRYNRISAPLRPSLRGGGVTKFSLPALLAILLLGGLFWGTLWAEDGRVAESAQDIHPLLVGMEIPDVSYQKADGTQVSLKELAAQKPIVMIYYRGGW
ncbi:MAG TPA: hypothetical protein VLV83_17550 [Acidobacteriota bacterium]|nr:hypothetical protein [Acidobacteriota bacterium]